MINMYSIDAPILHTNPLNSLLLKLTLSSVSTSSNSYLPKLGIIVFSVTLVSKIEPAIIATNIINN